MFKRNARSDTFGMSSAVARRTRDRAAGRIAAETGRHRGGPCPAVAFATLTGWSYARAERYLKDHGFSGAGMFKLPIIRAFCQMFGRPLREYSERDLRGKSTAQAVLDHARGNDGIAFCPGHVMPIRNGRLLNASDRHRALRCDGLVLWAISEEA